MLSEIDENSFALTLDMAKVKKNREELEVKLTEELTDLIDKVGT